MDKGVYVNYHLSGKKHKAALKRAAQSKEMGSILPRVTVSESSEIKILNESATDDASQEGPTPKGTDLFSGKCS